MITHICKCGNLTSPRAPALCPTCWKRSEHCQCPVDEMARYMNTPCTRCDEATTHTCTCEYAKNH